MIDKKQTASDSSDMIHYVIVVHGIGQQRKNETVLPVIKQFAAARHNNAKQADFMTLGRLSSQTSEKPWIEYQGIPTQPDTALHGKVWIPQLATGQQGKNIRFVDFCWSEVTADQYAIAGETTKVWSDALINRLKLRVTLEDSCSGKIEEKPTQWIVDMMKVLQEGILFVEKIMDLRIPKLWLFRICRETMP